MGKTTYSSLITEKISELKSDIAALKVRDDISKNTRGTQLYKLGRDRRVLQLLSEVITDDTKLSDAAKDTLILITTLSSERAVRQQVEVKEGDLILDLMQKYADKKDLLSKLNTAAEKSGLKLDFSAGKVIKA